MVIFFIHLSRFQLIPESRDFPAPMLKYEAAFALGNYVFPWVEENHKGMSQSQILMLF